MITESELRECLAYDDSHLRPLSGPEVAAKVRQGQIQRRMRVGSVAAGVALLAAGAGYASWERRPHVIHADIAYASGPTLVLPDGRVDLGLSKGDGPTRAWLDSEDRICYGDDAGSVCTHPIADETQRFTVTSTSGDGLLGGLVHRPIRSATFTAPDGKELPTQVIGFEKFPGWRVVIAIVPRTAAGTVPGPEHFRFASS